MFRYFNVIDTDSHDCEILQSVLEDGNYDISSEDCVSLFSCASLISAQTKHQ